MQFFHFRAAYIFFVFLVISNGVCFSAISLLAWSPHIHYHFRVQFSRFLIIEASSNFPPYSFYPPFIFSGIPDVSSEEVKFYHYSFVTSFGRHWSRFSTIQYFYNSEPWNRMWTYAFSNSNMRIWKSPYCLHMDTSILAFLFHFLLR